MLNRTIRNSLLLVLLSVSIIVTGFIVVDSIVQTGVSVEDERTDIVFEPTNNSATIVDAEIASTPDERVTGLSNRDSLSDGKGMLFVYPSQGKRAFTMREMSFGLDIVFIGSDCKITKIHNADSPQTNQTPSEDDYLYKGSGKYAVEIPYGYTDKIGVEESDRVKISSEEIGSGCRQASE